MDNEENQTTAGQPTPAAPAPTPEPSSGEQSLLQKHSGLKTLMGVAGVAVFLLAAIAIRNNYLEGRLQGTGADASCYGYNCQPDVFIGGRVYVPGYNNNPFSYGVLSIKRGQPIELTWYGVNVDSCTAYWTDFKGIYYPPTPYKERISTSQNMKVMCAKGGRIVVNKALYIDIVSR